MFFLAYFVFLGFLIVSTKFITKRHTPSKQRVYWVVWMGFFQLLLRDVVGFRSLSLSLLVYSALLLHHYFLLSLTSNRFKGFFLLTETLKQQTNILNLDNTISKYLSMKKITVTNRQPSQKAIMHKGVTNGWYFSRH